MLTHLSCCDYRMSLKMSSHTQELTNSQKLLIMKMDTEHQNGRILLSIPRFETIFLALTRSSNEQEYETHRKQLQKLSVLSRHI